MPTFSVVIVNYNYGRYLEQAIRSILEQSYKSFELIVIDGGSKDNSLEVIEKYSKQISWWISEKDKGQSDALNKGFSKAIGDYFLWVNADDLLLPGALAAAAHELELHPDCKWLTADTVLFDSKGKIYRCLYGGHWNTWLMKKTYITNIINAPSSIFHHTLFEKVGGFDPDLHYVMDFDLWIKFVDSGARFQKLRYFIWCFRIHDGSKTNNEIGCLPNENTIQEAAKVISRANRKRMWAELFLLRIFKILTGTHFHTLYDTWRWRGKPIERMINFLSFSKIKKESDLFK